MIKITRKAIEHLRGVFDDVIDTPHVGECLRITKEYGDPELVVDEQRDGDEVLHDGDYVLLVMAPRTMQDFDGHLLDIQDGQLEFWDQREVSRK